MGTPDYAVLPLEALLNGPYEVKCVLTQPDRPKGRGYEVCMSPVKKTAVRHGVPVLQPVKMKDPDLIRQLESFDADYFIVAAYGRILPTEILDIPAKGCINIHASLLPAYRGAAPIQWAILDGQKESGITTMKMDAGVDTGDILRQYRIPIREDETGGSLFDRLRELGAKALLDTLTGLEKGEIHPVKQGEPSTGYAKMLTREMGNIDWDRNPEEIERSVRALDPWPGCYTFLNGRQLKILRSHVVSGSGEEKEPGIILKAQENDLWVKTGFGGILSIDAIQPEGKKKMETASFLRGAHIVSGDYLRRDK